MASFYGLDPSRVHKQRQEKERKIDATVTEIAKNGVVEIKYNPPIVEVPSDWREYFDLSMLAELDEPERLERIQEAKKLMHMTFE